jgi:Zn-dependent protease with chaperone function
MAMKIAGRRVVVLFSGAVDSLLLKGSITQLGWLVGHELGHHFAGHLNFWRHTTAQLGSWFVWVGLWYKRRCEFTCDRYGLACAASLPESLRAICNMAVGAQLAPDVDIDQAVAQWNRHSTEFFVKYRTLYSTHPQTLCRLDELGKAARELGIR